MNDHVTHEIRFTGEFAGPEGTPAATWSEHAARYQYAAPIVSGKDVLDIACGLGYGAHFLAGSARRVVGADINSDLVKVANTQYRRPNIGYLVADATRLPFGKETFHVVVSFETIEHLRDPDLFLLECARVLKGGGRFVCSTPNRRLISRWGSRPTNPFHVREFTELEFLENVGKHFTDIQLFCQRPRNNAVMLCFNLLGLLPFGVVAKRTALRTRNLLSVKAPNQHPPVDRVVPEKFKVTPVDQVRGLPSYFIIVGRKPA